jgi:hypothetical protein
MKVEVNQKVDGVGNELYMISYTDSGSCTNELFLGNGHKDVLLQFFKRNEWSEEFVNEEYSNVNWVFSDKDIDDDDFDEDEFEGEGVEKIDVDLIGIVL